MSYWNATGNCCVNEFKKPKDNGVAVYDNNSGKHHGPIFPIQRNFTHSNFFVTVGDWTARIWAEDLKSPSNNSLAHPQPNEKV